MIPERTDAEIIEALERWLKRIPDVKEKMYSVPSLKQALTFSEALQEVKNGTEFGKKWVNLLRRIAESHDIDVIEFIDNIKQ